MGLSFSKFRLAAQGLRAALAWPTRRQARGARSAAAPINDVGDPTIPNIVKQPGCCSRKSMRSVAKLLRAMERTSESQPRSNVIARWPHNIDDILQTEALEIAISTAPRIIDIHPVSRREPTFLPDFQSG
jgi:hypothetical protein